MPSDIKEGKTINLKENGENIMVTDKNKREFILLVVDYFCSKSCLHYIQGIKEGIERVLPVKYLEIFEPYEMEMLLNGPQQINAQEWKASTLYKDCKPNDKQIVWFWKYVEALSQ